VGREAAILNEEIHLIHYANRLFWGEAKVQSREARVEYYRRLDRLERIRRTLATLSPGTHIPATLSHRR
jgi:hypothetical protein